MNLTTSLTITIQGDEAILEPKVTESVVYMVGGFFGSASILDAMKLFGCTPESASSVECPVGIDPWRESGSIERHFYDVFRRHDLDLTNRSFHEMVTRADVMRFLRVAPHQMILASTHRCGQVGQLWIRTPHDVMSPFWFNMGSASLYELACWRDSHLDAYENLLAALAGVRMVLCSVDRVAS